MAMEFYEMIPLSKSNILQQHNQILQTNKSNKQ